MIELISFMTTIEYDGKICFLVGATDKVEVCNAKEFYFSKEKMKEWKHTLNKLLNKEESLKENDNENKYEEDLENIIKYIVSKMEKEYKLYSELVEKLKNMIINKIDKFSLEEKKRIILELFHLLKVNSTTANFKFLQEASAFGRMNNKTIRSGKLVNNSITGLRKNIHEF